MALTYNWELTGLRKQNTDDLTDVVIGTQWKVTATDADGNQGSFSGATPFKISDVDPNNFTSYSDLTQEQILSWVKSIVSGSNPSTNYWQHINERIVDQINMQKYSRTEVSSTEFPWVSSNGSTQPTSGSNI